jgi:lipid A 3-O-deacylase
MTTIQRLLVLLAAALILILAPRLQAGPAAPAAATASTDADPIFYHGALELQLVNGVEFSQQRTSYERPNLDYTLSALRLGYMVDSPHPGGTFLRGNDELLVEAAGGAIFQGPGSGLGGLAIIYRRNFLAPNAKVVPYINAGAGGVYSDAYHDQVQRILGSKFEFDLLGSVGVRFRVTSHMSLDGEVEFRHLSNADLAARNYGTNDIGGVLGVSFTF